MSRKERENWFTYNTTEKLRTVLENALENSTLNANISPMRGVGWVLIPEDIIFIPTV